MTVRESKGGAALVTHSVVVSAPARSVYELIADVTRWPVMFEPTVHVDRWTRSATEELFTIWAVVNGAVVSWRSRRHFDPVNLRVTFRQEQSTPPIAGMAGRWEFHRLVAGRTQVLLHHEFSTVDGSPEAAALVTRALDRNSDSELATLARTAELGHPVDDLVFSFEDSVQVRGPVRRAYEFVEQAGNWPYRLPHVSDVRLREDPPGVQRLDMVTRTGDGAEHTTSSIRVCTPGERIVYKQTVLPTALLGHSGSWVFGGGGVVTARHTVMLDPAGIGHDGGVAGARQAVRDALGANSLVTLQAARAYADGQ